MTQDAPLTALLHQSLQARSSFFDDNHEAAFRLFNGFLEGSPDLVADLYARTLVLVNHANLPDHGRPLIQAAQEYYLKQLPWLEAVLVKTRNAAYDEHRRGVLTFGSKPSRKAREHGVWYALDLTINLDTSLYLDTRSLRGWAIDHLAGKRVLNTFAYTGSLGVAAAKAGARQVIHIDLNRRFLNLAKDSYALNGFPIQRADFITGDFFVEINQLKRAGGLFDCIFVDPPFFSTTGRGKVDLVSESGRMLNKVRPLVGHNGWLVVINNALFLSGAEFMEMLQGQCADGYLSIEEIIPIPPDFTGFPETIKAQPPVDPAPFNHSTKIAILRVTRKDQRSAEAE